MNVSVRYFALVIFLISVNSVFAKSPSLVALPDSLEKITFQELYQYDEDDMQELTEELNKALILNSGSIDLNLLRAKIYLHSKKYGAAKSILLRLNKIDPQNGKVNYFLSRLYAETDSLKQSYNYMIKINKDLSYDETFIKELIDDQLPFLSRLEKQYLEESDNKVEMILRNWFYKDPSPASIENEYFTNMLQRLDYAYENFYDGFYFDDRGKIYLRYGMPEVRREYFHTGFATECWIYRKTLKREVTFDFIRTIQKPGWKEIKYIHDIPGDTFVNRKFDYSTFDDSVPSSSFFEDRAMLSNKYNQIYAEMQALAINVDPSTDLNSGPKNDIGPESENFFITDYFNKEREVKNGIPEVVIETPVPEVGLSVDFCRFKSDSASVNLETYLGMSIKEVNQVIDGEIYRSLKLNEKLSIKDENLVPVVNHKDQVDFNFDNVEQAHFIDMMQFTIPAENFVMAFEVDDNARRFIASKILEVQMKDFLQDDLFLSDIQLTFDIKQNPYGVDRFTKNGLRIQPYPYLMYSREAPLFLYFEIYNLVKDHGFTDYTISYGLAKSYEKSILEKIFTVDFSSDPGSIQFNQDYNGNKTDDFIYFQINASNLDIGEYLLKVKVTDKVSGKSFERDKKFFLTQ